MIKPIAVLIKKRTQFVYLYRYPNKILSNFQSILIIYDNFRRHLLYGVFFFVFVGQKIPTSNDSQTHRSFDTRKMVPNSSIPIPQTITYSILSDFEATFTARPSFLPSSRLGGEGASQSQKNLLLACSTCYSYQLLVTSTLVLVLVTCTLEFF